MSFKFLDDLLSTALDVPKEPKKVIIEPKSTTKIDEESLLAKREFKGLEFSNEDTQKLTNLNLYSPQNPNFIQNKKVSGVDCIKELVQDDTKVTSKIVNKKFTFKNLFGKRKQLSKQQISEKFGNFNLSSNNEKMVSENCIKIVNPDEEEYVNEHQPENFAKSKIRKRVCRKVLEKDLDFNEFKQMNAMWENYMSKQLDTEKNPEVAYTKIMKGDLHGAYIFVKSSKNKTVEGINGIVLFETLKSLIILTPDSQVKTLMKEESIFFMRHKDNYYKIFGARLSLKPELRSIMKVKWKNFDNNTAKLLNTFKNK